MLLAETHTGLIRGLIALLTLLLFVAAVATFINYASSPTDENVFARTKAKMNLYVTENIPAIPLKRITGAPYAAGEESPDPFVATGDLINLVGTSAVYTRDELARALAAAPPDSTMVLTIYRAERGAFIPYRVERRAVADSMVTEISDFIEVTDVTPGGASDRAGMKVGDLIFRINGQGFRNEQEADQILRRGQAGKAITYEVLRRNTRLALHVTLAQFGFPVSLLVFSLSGMFTFGVGAFIALRRPRIRAARALGVGLLLLGYFVTVVLIRRDPEVDLFVFLRNAMVVVSILFGTAMLLWSMALFPRERPDLTARKWIPWGGYALAFAGLTATRFLGDLAMLGSLAAIVMYYGAVRIVYRKGATAEHKRLSRAIKFTGAAVAVVSIGSMVAAPFFGRLGIFWVIGLALAAIPLSYLYTIGRYRLLDLKVRIKRNIQYTLVSVAWGTLLAYGLLELFVLFSARELHFPAIVIRGTSVEVVTEPHAGTPPEWTNRFVLMALGVALWYGFWKLRRAGQSWIDRKYYRTQYDYRRAVSELGAVLAKTLSMADLGRGLAERLAALMQVKRAGVFFFRDGSVSACHEAYGIEHERWAAFCTPVEEGLFAALRNASTSLRSEYLPAPMNEQFRSYEFHLLVPVRSKAQLLGALVLGEKRSEATYREEDYEFLAAAAQQASVAMENAFLYEELAEKERLKHELEIARRIQMASLPQETPSLKGLDIAGISVPAMEVGGDFFDYLNGTADKMTLVVGDVSGKGTSAALYMSKIQGILRSLHDFGLSPGDLFIRANRLLCGDLEKKSFVTAVGAAFDAQARVVVLARAGHLPLYHFKLTDGAVEKVTPRGLGLGLNNAGLFSSELEQKIVRYATGDVLAFVTDGVTEAQNLSGELFGEERLISLLTASAPSGAAAIRDELLRAVRAFAGEAPQHDDETIVIVKGV
ncbi:MAG: SpoIIE family protein phosphatase [Bacteroidota bacterium]